MTRGDLDGLTIFKRPIKPVAFGLSLTMTTMIAFNVSNQDVLGDHPITEVVLVMAVIGLASLSAGWLFSSQRMAEAGLFIAGLTMTLRSAFLLALIGAGGVGVWLGIATAIVAFGAFLLERTDTNRGQWWPTSSRKE